MGAVDDQMRSNDQRDHRGAGDADREDGQGRRQPGQHRCVKPSIPLPAEMPVHRQRQEERERNVRLGDKALVEELHRGDEDHRGGQRLALGNSETRERVRGKGERDRERHVPHPERPLRRAERREREAHQPEHERRLVDDRPGGVAKRQPVARGQNILGDLAVERGHAVRQGQWQAEEQHNDRRNQQAEPEAGFGIRERAHPARFVEERTVSCAGSCRATGET